MGGFAIETTAIGAPFKFICIRPTGGGKSLLYQALALHFKKVTLCITPILALGSDQMQKIAKVPDTNLLAFHMDELSDEHIIRLKDHLEILHPDNAVIILASPLFLNNCGKQFLKFLFQRNFIQMVVMDELHLSHHFARSFRDDFDELKEIVFSCIHPHIPCIFMTATCSNEIIAASQRIFGFELMYTDWPTVKDMANRKQSFVANYTPVGIRYIYNIIDSQLSKQAIDTQGRPLPNKMMYYGNS